MTNISTSFFSTLHAIEAVDEDASPLYLQGYDSVMTDITYALEFGDVTNLEQLDAFVNQLDAYAEDYKPGDFAHGYQDAVNVLLEVVNQLS